ncbi:recombination protein RecO [Sulfurimonas sp. HSL3-7]|uniref:recombination protein RecO n=1 Tax=Sulfonitrofixus jiaomeiensis TaxID=3131938 RepID=UPI0031F7830A
MQGFIISLNRARDEDLVVTILSQNRLDTLYRFYGARHGVINLGFKIDFEIITNVKSNIGQLRDVLHIGYPWLTDHHQLRTWQQFTALFYPHLRESEDTGSFYFELLDQAASSWGKQNPKRVAVESYVRLLEHEGRLHSELNCFFCDAPITKEVSLIRSYLPAHPNCAHTLSIDQKGLMELFENHSSLFLSDKEVERLWLVLLEGL